jgi:hypothetical protein
MSEIWIPEFFIVLFLFLALVRPWIKRLAPQAGIDWFPLLAFFLSIGLFPAYGFRLEALPLVVFTLVFCFRTFLFMLPGRAKMRAGTSGYRNFSRENPVSRFLSLVFLVFCLVFAFIFSPLESNEGDRPEFSAFRLDNEEENRSFDIKVYGERGGRPLLVLSSPFLGAPALDHVCLELEKCGFTVLSMVKRGRKAELFSRFRAWTAGTRFAAANRRGKALEEAGQKECLFILDWIAKNPPGTDSSTRADAAEEDIFLGAYGAGASSLVLLAGDPVFVRSNPKVKGMIAVEPPLWSLFREEERQSKSLPPDFSWFESVKSGLRNWIASLKPGKIAGLGEIPGAEISVLFLVSDRALGSPQTEHYKAVYGSLQAARKASALAAVSGAGPFDYAGFPSKYPLLSLIFSGRSQSAWSAREAAGGTARIITNFAALLTDAPLSSGGNSGGSSAVDIHVEKRSWNLPNLGL